MPCHKGPGTWTASCPETPAMDRQSAQILSSTDRGCHSLQIRRGHWWCLACQNRRSKWHPGARSCLLWSHRNGRQLHSTLWESLCSNFYVESATLAFRLSYQSLPGQYSMALEFQFGAGKSRQWHEILEIQTKSSAENFNSKQSVVLWIPSNTSVKGLPFGLHTLVLSPSYPKSSLISL